MPLNVETLSGTASTRRLLSGRRAAFLAMMLLAACSADAGPGRGLVSPYVPSGSSGSIPTSLSISPTALNASVGDTVQLIATLRDSRGVAINNATIAWNSADTSIVTVTRGGLAVGVGVGQTIVSASAGSISAQAAVVIATDPVSAITVDPSSASISVGETRLLDVTLYNSKGGVVNGRHVNWSSASPGIATVDGSGYVTGKSAGKATITASSGSHSGTATVTVDAQTATAPGTVNDLAAVGASDSSVALTFTAVDNGAGQPASYVVHYAAGTMNWGTSPSVSQGSCASPLAGAAAGSKMTCTVAGLSASTGYQFQIVAFRGKLDSDVVYGGFSNVAGAATLASQVTSATSGVASVSVSPASATDTVGQSTQLSAVVRDANGNTLSGQTVTWTSSNTGVATVSSSGLMKAVGTGSATITAASGGKSGSAAVSIVAAGTGTPGTVTDLSATAASDSSVAITFTAVNDGTGQPASYDLRFAAGTISWGSASSVSSGSCSTPISGAAIGTTVHCTVLGLSPSTGYQFQIVAFQGTLNQNAVYGSLSNVANATTSAGSTVAVASVTVTPSSVSDSVGQSAQLSAVVRDANGNTLSGQTVTWASSNSAVATVSDSGVMKAVGTGSATITASSGAKSGSAAVSVAAGTTTSAPATVSDLSANATSDSSVAITFTAVNDGTGQPASYDLRFAAGTISWGSATSVSSGSCSTPISGAAIGTTVHCTVLGLSASTGYQFQIVAFRGTFGVNTVYGSLSNVAGATTSAGSAVAVASVTVTPSSVSDSVGQSAQLSAVVRDANGNTLTGQTITWASSNSAVATVSSSGVMTAVGGGSATITASSGGKSGSASVSVAGTSQPPVASGSAYPDLPSGYTMPSNYVDEFTNSSLAEGIFTTDASHPNFTQRNASTYSPGGGVSAPVNPPASAPYIGEIRYPAGMSAGSAPAHLYAGVSGRNWTHIYVAYTIQLSSNWYGQSSSGTNKIGYVWMHANPSVFLVAHGQGTGSLRWEVDLQNVASGAARLTDNLGQNATVTRGKWQRVEMELIANTPGVANGIVRLWLTNYDANGNQVGAPVQILQYSNIEFAGSGQSNTWEQVTWYPVWGGVGGTLPVTQYQWMDRLAIAGQ